VVHPAKEASSGVLRERVSNFVWSDRDIGVADGTGGDKDCGARGELDYELEIL